MIALEYVLGDTLKATQVTIKDANDAVVNLTGGTVNWQASSQDGPRFDYLSLLSTTVGVNTVTRSSGNFTTDGVQIGQQLAGAISAMFAPNARIITVGTTTVTMSSNALASLSAQSGTILGATMDIAGTLVDAPNGICSFAGIGNALTSAQVGARKQVNFTALVKYTASGGLIGYSDKITFKIVRPPL